MKLTAQPAPLVFSTAFGALMCVAAAVDGDRLGLLAAALCGIAVSAGILYRHAATFAVICAASAIVLSQPPTLFAAVSGLAGTAYLVLRHAADDAAAVVTTTWPTVVGMVGFSVTGVVATTVPLRALWLPLLAPPVVVVLFALAITPFVGGSRHIESRERQA